MADLIGMRSVVARGPPNDLFEVGSEAEWLGLVGIDDFR